MASHSVFALLAIAFVATAAAQQPQQQQQQQGDQQQNQQADAIFGFISRLIPGQFNIPFQQQANAAQNTQQAQAQPQQPAMQMNQQQPFQLPNLGMNGMNGFQIPDQFRNFFQPMTMSTQEEASTTTAAPEPQLPVQCILSGGFPQIDGFPCFGTKVDGWAWNIVSKSCTKSSYCKSQWGDFGGMQNFATEAECQKTCDLSVTTAAPTTVVPARG